MLYTHDWERYSKVREMSACGTLPPPNRPVDGRTMVTTVNCGEAVTSRVVRVTDSVVPLGEALLAVRKGTAKFVPVILYVWVRLLMLLASRRVIDPVQTDGVVMDTVVEAIT